MENMRYVRRSPSKGKLEGVDRIIEKGQITIGKQIVTTLVMESGLKYQVLWIEGVDETVKESIYVMDKSGADVELIRTRVIERSEQAHINENFAAYLEKL